MKMAEVLLPYTTDLFNSLPDLHTASTNFASKGGITLVNDIFKAIIEKYHLEGKLGVGLLHRHFDLSGVEKLVEFNNISMPWANQDAEDNYSGGKILPNAWAVRGNRLVPYEFYYSPLGRESHFDFAAIHLFLHEFMQAIATFSFQDTVALRLFPHKGFRGALELTEGRANINLSPEQVPENGWEDATETMWFFEPEYVKKKWMCRCKPYSGHMHLHGN